MEREDQRRESTGLEGEDERAKERNTHRWDCVESCRERDVSGPKGSEGAGFHPAVWEWPRCGGGCVVQTRYSNSRCLPQVVRCSEMSNKEDTSMAGPRCVVGDGDNHYTASSSSPSRLTDFEIKECKKEPDSSWANDDLSEFDKSSTNLQRTLHIPAPVLTMKNPVVFLERCDKIWETLQLIRVQCASPTIESEDEKEKKKEKRANQEATPWNMTFPIKSQRRLTNESKTPFQFSVQKTRRLYPCITCGKQYLEKRSLRRHALRQHGIIIPVRHRKPRKPRIIDKQDWNTSFSKGNNNSNKVLHNKYSYGKITTGKSEVTKLAPIFTNFKGSQYVSDVDSSNNQSENTNIEPFVSSKARYNKCALCRQEVKCVKKHLINYHKIGCSANMLKQLETSLMIKNKSSGSSKPMLKDILSGKPPKASVNKVTQNKHHLASSENRTRESLQVIPQKRKYTLSYVNTKKRFKLNNGHYVPVQKASHIAQKHASIENKCDICLGVYASTHTLAKHRRIHVSRGETKENFHKFVCKYFNSPMSKRYQQQQQAASSAQSADTDVENETSRSSNPKMSPSQDHRTDRAYDANKEDTTCLCGRSFRNHYILRAHKDNCKSYKQKDNMAQHSARDEYSSDRDSGIGINITIKKRNNSYEIVGKDDDEDKQDNHVADSIPSFDIASHDAVKDVNADTRRKRLSESNTSKYSKSHSILKLQDADEDLFIDIGDDIHLVSKHKREQTAVQRDNESCSRTRQNDDAANAKEDNMLDNVCSLKQLCQEVLKKLAMFQKPETTKASTQPEKKRSQSMNASHETMEKQHVKSGVFMANFDPTTCAYCDKHFGTISLYNKHQCTVEEGRTFDEYSLNLLCFSCNATLDSCSQFDEHMKIKHHVRSYYCYLCPKKFWNKKARNKHANTEHDTSCRFCHMNVPLWIINLHEAYHLGFGYPCHKCKKAYSTKKNLSYHTTIHKNGVDTMAFCNLCLKSVKLKTFRSHIHSHDGKKCHFCDKEFNDRATLEYHTLIYHGGTFSSSKLKCNDCGIRYLTKRQLEQHRITSGCDGVKKIKKDDML